MLPGVTFTHDSPAGPCQQSRLASGRPCPGSASQSQQCPAPQQCALPQPASALQSCTFKMTKSAGGASSSVQCFGGVPCHVAGWATSQATSLGQHLSSTLCLQTYLLQSSRAEIRSASQSHCAHSLTELCRYQRATWSAAARQEHRRRTSGSSSRKLQGIAGRFTAGPARQNLHDCISKGIESLVREISSLQAMLSGVAKDLSSAQHSCRELGPLV